MFSFTKSPPKKSKGSHKFPVLKIGAFETAFLIADIQSGESNFWHSSPCEEKFSTLKTNSPHKKRNPGQQIVKCHHRSTHHGNIEQSKRKNAFPSAIDPYFTDHKIRKKNPEKDPGSKTFPKNSKSSSNPYWN
ncbi:hypothetical protein [Fibrobacter intestinalis]|uniref:hypothetical protein n=1 Tax=Fibrobacter TaxID=832 RepID=UPI00117A2443|nr:MULTISPECIES: hypothetical protein [Fibrobacter]